MKWSSASSGAFALVAAVCLGCSSSPTISLLPSPPAGDGAIVGTLQHCLGNPPSPPATPAFVAGIVKVFQSQPQPEGPLPREPLAQQTTGANGRFDFILKPGRYTLVATWTGSNLGPISKGFDVQAGQVVQGTLMFVNCM